jgi:Mn-dependent DtxR family transcriptional regulator
MNMNVSTLEKELLCIKDIMKRLNIGRPAATEIMHKLSPERIGKRYYIPKQTLENWITSFTTK